jgi:predicted O-methyltransferase YrrM
MRIFEYGSGGSTIYLAKKGERIVSVEHDAQWYQAVNENLKRYQISNVEYILKVPLKKDTAIRDPADPYSYSSGFKRQLQGSGFKKEFQGMDFSEYVKTIDNFEDHYFDVILIDGRARSSCIMHSVNKVKSNGVIILDNSDRKRYTFAQIKYLSYYKCKRYFGICPYKIKPEETAIYSK